MKLLTIYKDVGLMYHVHIEAMGTEIYIPPAAYEDMQMEYMFLIDDNNDTPLNLTDSRQFVMMSGTIPICRKMENYPESYRLKYPDLANTTITTINIRIDLIATVLENE